MRILLCESTAVTCLVNAGTQQGVVAWSPRDLVEAVFVGPQRRLEGDIAGRIAHYDRDADRCENTSGETFLPLARIGVALRMLPEGVPKQHLVLNSRLTSLDLEAEIDNARRAQAGAWNNPQPNDLSQVSPKLQDINALPEGRWSGKGKDKGKQHDIKGSNINEPKNPCPIWGKLGHWRRGCW